MNPTEQFDYLFNAFASRKCTAEEKLELMKLIDSGNYDSRLRELVGAKWSEAIPEQIRDNEAERAEAVYQRIIEHVKVTKVRKITPWWRYAAAAVVILAVAGALWLFVGKQAGKNVNPTELAQKTDVKPPSVNKAVITLANGQQIILDSAGNGTLAQQGNINIIKKEDGDIAYEGAASNATVSYNTLSNPRGSKVISLTLSDGSKVWLNSGSSLKYPTAFSGKERKVEITGEAYFEVAHHVIASGARQSFIVQKGNMEVTVLGTHFNVNAYDDEPDMKVTLLQGSVKVTEGQNEVTIKPGEQAIVTHDSQLTTDNSPDLEEVMAWKNGEFIMNDAGIDAIMRQVSRWYDVDVTYKNGIPAGHLSGDIPRSMNLSEVLKVMQLSGVKYEIEGKKVIVSE